MWRPLPATGWTARAARPASRTGDGMPSSLSICRGAARLSAVTVKGNRAAASRMIAFIRIDVTGALANSRESRWLTENANLSLAYLLRRARERNSTTRQPGTSRELDPGQESGVTQTVKSASSRITFQAPLCGCAKDSSRDDASVDVKRINPIV